MKVQPGDRVEVTTRYKNYVVGRSGEFVENSYVGKVREPEPWFKKDEFAVSCVGEPYITFHVISMKHVSALKVNDKDAPLINSSNDSISYVTVKGSKGNEYEVTLVNGIAQSCTCKGFQFRKRCRHLSEAVDNNPNHR